MEIRRRRSIVEVIVLVDCDEAKVGAEGSAAVGAALRGAAVADRPTSGEIGRSDFIEAPEEA